MFQDITSCLPLKRCKVVAILGTAGIGKSSFFIVCLDEYLKNPSSLGHDTGCKSFYYQTGHSDVWVYEFKGEYMNDKQLTTYEFNERKLEFIEISNTGTEWPLFADLKSDDTLPMSHWGATLIFSTNTLRSYKEVTKQGWLKIMPTWTVTELETYVLSEYFKKNRNVDETTCARIFKNSHIFGGVIRHIINSIYYLSDEPERMIEQALMANGTAVSDRFCRAGLGGTEDDICDLLVHRNPAVKEDGSFNYDAYAMNFNFASPYVLKKFTVLNHNGFVAAAKQKYSSGA
jgi:hypothetical protein